MPILTCPTCGSKLEVADEDVGHTVQCGSCQQTFVAEDPDRPKRDSGEKKKPYSFRRDDDGDDRPSRRRDRDDDDERPSRRRRREEEEDDDRDSGYRRRRSYSDEDYEDRYQPPPRTGMGVASMTLGIVSVLFGWCWLIGPITAILALIFGLLSLKTEGKGMGIAGIIMAVLSFLIFAAFIVFVVVMNVANAGGGPGGGGGGRF